MINARVTVLKGKKKGAKVFDVSREAAQLVPSAAVGGGRGGGGGGVVCTPSLWMTDEL